MLSFCCCPAESEPFSSARVTCTLRGGQEVRLPCGDGGRKSSCGLPAPWHSCTACDTSAPRERAVRSEHMCHPAGQPRRQLQEALGVQRAKPQEPRLSLWRLISFQSGKAVARSPVKVLTWTSSVHTKWQVGGEVQVHMPMGPQQHSESCKAAGSAGATGNMLLHRCPPHSRRCAVAGRPPGGSAAPARLSSTQCSGKGGVIGPGRGRRSL